MDPRKNYPALLKKELEEELAKIDDEITILKIKIYTINSRYLTLKKLHAAGQLSESDQDSIAGCWEDAGRFTRELHECEKRKVNVASQRKNVVERDADKLFEEARNIERRTGKNKLYIGNRQFVAGYADSKENSADANRRILNAANWTWGVNFAWIEGGTVAAARIKIKENEKNPNDFECIPEGAYAEMMIRPRMTGKDWLALCQKYPNSILWHGGQSRPTWTALEIEACLNAGYRFDFREHKHRVGRVIELVRR
jgi:hypothetical protein